MKLSRKKPHREHLLKNLITSLVLYERIKTTEAKARFIIPTFSHLLKVAKKGDLNARRTLNQFFPVKEATAKILESLAPRFKDESSGFLRIFKVEPRKGDNAPQVILEVAKPLEKQKNEKTKKTNSPH